jgi:hypothetical protein
MTEEEAKKRFMQLQLVRLLGVAFVMAGAANVAGKWLPDLAPWLGLILMINGAVDFFVLPMLLKKKWQNPSE